MENPVKVLFPTKFLIPSNALLNPHNTETIWEYYLLENLSCGLVLDDSRSPDGFRGCLSSEYYREGLNAWVFKIRDVLWSDGSRLTEDQIFEWFDHLKNKPHRHIRFLKKATRVSFDSTSQLLKIEFPFPVDEIILHELSLADAGFFPTNYEKEGWTTTLGPYFVKKWDFLNSRLELSANQNSPFYSTDMPQNLVLFPSPTSVSRNLFFKEKIFDLVLLTAPTNIIAAEEIASAKPRIWESHNINSLFFIFNSKNPLTSNLMARKEFALIIAEFRKSVEILTEGLIPFIPETQIIPFGFRGRIADDFLMNQQPETIKISQIAKKTLIIKFPAALQHRKVFFEKLKELFMRYEVQLEARFNDAAIQDDEFAHLTSFLGNQNDPSGTWSFLTDENFGSLKDWQDLYEEEYDKAFNSNFRDERDKAFSALQLKILNEYLLVPLMIGKQRYLHQNFLDLSKLNRFDARMRFFDMIRR